MTPGPCPDCHSDARQTEPSPPASVSPSLGWGQIALAVFVGGMATVAACYLIYKLRLVLSIFAAGYLVAHLCEPLIQLVQRTGMTRGRAVWSVLGLLLLALAFAALVPLPALVDQAQDAAENWPVYSQRAEELYASWRERIEAGVGRHYPGVNVTDMLDQRIEHTRRRLEEQVPQLLEWVSRQLVASLGLLGVLLLVMVIGLQFMMLRGPLEAAVRRLVPPQHSEEVAEVQHQIAAMLGSYIRGMVMLAALLGAATWAAMAIIGLFVGSKYALVVGAMACFAPFVPYVGSAATMAAAGLLTYVTAHYSPATSGVVAALCVLLLDQTFDLIVRPNLIGRRIDLHPMLGIFSVLAGYSVLGVSGLLLGMPIAAGIKIVLAKWVPVIGLSPGVRAPGEPLLLDMAEVATQAWSGLRAWAGRLFGGH